MAQATRATTFLSSMPKGSGGQQGFERFMDKVVDIEETIVKEIDMLIDEKAATLEMIELLIDATHRDVLRCRYIEQMNLDKTAMMVPCSRATVWRVEKRAIEELEIIMEYYGIMKRMKQSNVINW